MRDACSVTSIYFQGLLNVAYA